MKFFLDHDVPAEVARVLRQEGHDVIELRQVLPVQTTDAEVYDYVGENGLLRFFFVSIRGPDLPEVFRLFVSALLGVR